MTSSSRRSEQGHVAQEKISPRGGGSAAVDFFFIFPSYAPPVAEEHSPLKLDG
jgi:hypothetical protein